MSKKQAFNPYLPSWEYVPDGEPYVFGDRVYIYGSHDMWNGYVFCMGDYVCWSAPVDDLGSWRYEGVIYPRNTDTMNRDGHMCLYAPDVTVGPDGRYYLYYVLDKVGVMSVAVCDEPAGKYEFYGYVHYKDGTRLGEREGDEPQFDPGVITEGDRTYLYSGFCPEGDKSRTGSKAVILDKDMLTVLTEPQVVVPGICYSAGTQFEGHAFFEASSIRKVNGKYYFIYSSEVMHELCYAVSDEPLKGFSYGGVLVSNTDLHIGTYKPADMPSNRGANNHGSIIEINGEWYIFYHRHTNGTWFSRQGCAEKLTLNPNGSFDQAEITSCGLNGGPLKGRGEYPAYIACNIFGREPELYIGNLNAPRIMQDGRDGDEEIGYIYNIKDGTNIGFKYFECSGITKVSVTARGYGSGSFAVKTAWDGEELGEIEIENSNVWKKFTADIKIPDGVNAIWFTFKGKGDGSLGSLTLGSFSLE
ncbi:MAG: family 43 glycosylhydrolase [Ruminococcus sp.]|nr:family 43 glycosylhydrolase [Ruminococcus sp.]